MNKYAKLPNLLTSKELQKYLKLGRCKIQELLQSNQIPNFKIDNQYRVYATDLKEWMDELKRERQEEQDMLFGNIRKMSL